VGASLLVEFGLRCSSLDKHAKTLAYSVNVCPQLPAGHLLLAVEVILRPSDRPTELGWLRLNGVRLAEPRRIGTVLLWEGPLNALSASQMFAAADMVAWENSQPCPSWHHIKNAATCDGYVWKVYDYRRREVDAEDRRSPTHSLAYIPGCAVVCKSTDLVVIRYPYLEGTHRPQSVGQWATLIRFVQQLHQDAIVHGDLRLSNIVFGRHNGKVTVIDYDFAGRVGEKEYPKGFNRKIDDGARHRAATDRQALSFEHDWFAIASMMEKCTLERAEPKWQDAYELLKVPGMTGQVDRVVQILEDFPMLQITSLDHTTARSLAVTGGPGTGSPERK
jgi:hypothetical protein